MIGLSKEETIAVLSGHIRFIEAETPGENIPAYCPFHKSGQESRPSFYVYVGKSTHSRHTGMSFCHTCNEGYTLTGLLRRLKVGHKLIDTIKQELAASPQKKKPTLHTVKLDQPSLPEAVLGMFEYLPKSLVEDGYNVDLLRDYDVGFDRGRKRITFALRDHNGNLVGISGRTVRGDHPRYKIYRSEFYEVNRSYELDKKKILYGLDKFYPRRMYTCIDMPVVVCEGFKACLWCVQSGYPDTVALLGSHMSREQVLLLQRVTNRVVLFLDNDSAGREATEKIINQLYGIEVRVADYRSDEPISPDDLTKTEVRLAVEAALRP
jgi:DNA primase